MSFAIGENVGPYRIIEQLGQGGMATVYKAYHAALDRYVAIKVLHRAFMEDPNFLARFQREARVVARLEHPNIVPIYDFSEHSGQPYLVMKFIEGETLKARMLSGPLSKEEGLRIVDAIGQGLAYAHKRGVLHRDIKPSNVLMSPDGGIYLADFGLARMAQAGESTLSSDMMLGTPQYISPEQARGERDLDAGTDIYSFGVVLYEMVVGRVPFSADTPFSIIHDHIYTPLPLPHTLNPRVPAAAERVLLKALAKERADRFQHVEELVTAFRAAVGGQTLPEMPDQRTLAVPPPTTRRRGREETLVVPAEDLPADSAVPARPPVRRRSWLWIAAGLCLTCLCLGAFAMVARQSDGLSAGPVTSAAGADPVTAAQAASEADPGNPDLHLALADLYRESGDLRAAAAEYEKGGLLFLGNQAYAAAAKALADAIELSGRAFRPASEVSNALVQALTLGAGDPQTWPTAVAAAGRYPDEPWILAAAARSNIFAGDLPAARQQLDRATELAPSDPLANAVMAEWLAKNGEIDAARRRLERARELGRTIPWLQDYLAALDQQVNPGS